MERAEEPLPDRPLAGLREVFVSDRVPRDRRCYGGRSRLRAWRVWRRLVCLALAGLFLYPTAGAAASRPTPRSYVALGDSYTAGPGIPQLVGDPPGCVRSDHNYPHLVAPSLKLPEFRDASCSGASTADMTSPQNHGVGPSPNPAQVDRLDRNTRVVTLQIGGNDIGFYEIAYSCASYSPGGTPCQDRYVRNQVDELSRRIAAVAPRVTSVLRQIHARSPNARIYVVGYPTIVPDTGTGCWPRLPYAVADLPYLRAKERELNDMLRARAAANRSVYVETERPSIGHDGCQPPGIRWVEPVFDASGVPLHPNALGMQGMASAILATIRAHGRK
jgi:lysophospholipase L1-like esterase